MKTKMKKPLITIEGRKIEEWFASADWALGTLPLTYVPQYIEEAINISLEKAQEIIEEHFRELEQEKEKKNEPQAAELSEVSLEGLFDYCNQKKEQDTIEDQQVNREYVDKIAYSSQFKETIDDKWDKAKKEYEIRRGADYRSLEGPICQEWLDELKELITKYGLEYVQLIAASHPCAIILTSGGIKKEAKRHPPNSFFAKPEQAWKAYCETLDAYLRNWPESEGRFIWRVQPELKYNEKLDLWTIYSRFINPWS